MLTTQHHMYLSFHSVHPHALIQDFMAFVKWGESQIKTTKVLLGVAREGDFVKPGLSLFYVYNMYGGRSGPECPCSEPEALAFTGDEPGQGILTTVAAKSTNVFKRNLPTT